MPKIHDSYNMTLRGWTATRWNGSSFDQSSGTAGGSNVTIKKVGTGLPGYQALKKKGSFIPAMGYQFEKIDRTGWVGWSRIYKPENPAVYTTDVSNRGSTFGNSLMQDASYDHYLVLSAEERLVVDKQARTRLYSEIKNQRINLAILVAERQKTIDMLTKTVLRMGSALRAFRRGRFGAAAAQFSGMTPSQLKKWISKKRPAAQKAAASAWLELQYGWRPLLNDIYGACEKLQEFDIDRALKAQGKGSCGITQSSVSLENGPGGTPGLVRSTIYTGEYIVKYIAYFRIDIPIIPELAELGITNPAQVAWEVVPFSFVFDWFIPIGGWIASWDATLGVHFVDGCRTEFFRQKCDRENTIGSVFDGASYTGAGRHQTDTVKMVRSLINAFPDLPLPSFKNPVSTLHLINAAALLTVTSGRKK